jgi:hypothetical protein
VGVIGKRRFKAFMPRKQPFEPYWTGKWPKLEGADEWTAKARKCEYDLWVRGRKK